MAAGALLEVVLAFSVIAIAVMLYPVLKRQISRRWALCF
jgi:hypothetical protein